MTIIYALSGIALNHKMDWNPNYFITHEEVQWEGGIPSGNLTEDQVLDFLDQYGERDSYKKHYYPVPGRLKIFIDGGSFELDRSTSRGFVETIDKRPVFFEVNFLHYNPGRLWTWFSDVFCVALILLSITGMFVLKGRKGITGRGAWLTAIGVVIPLLFLLAYL